MTPSTITINVTQDDINKGIKLECRRCPIALAAQRTLNNPHVDVASSRMLVTAQQREVVYQLPDTAIAFIFAFDKMARVVPFSFVARIL